MISKIGFGGGCHWCTESVFQSLKAVQKVEQGWIASNDENEYFSEAVIVHYASALIDLESLIEIHLNTHSSTSAHSMRNKYRSAVYTFSAGQFKDCIKIIEGFQSAFNDQLITKVQTFIDFKPSPAQFQNYYLKNPQKPFCERYIKPKLELMNKKFPDLVK